ncbi:MAG: EscG/YscG/SsaH family type III secretion system needle protein co-chaperone [Plesiomonas sp.]
MDPSSELKQIIIEAALAGANNGLHQEVRVIMNNLEKLVSNKEICMLLQGMLLFGLGERDLARQSLCNCTLPESAILQKLLSI